MPPDPASAPAAEETPKPAPVVPAAPKEQPEPASALHSRYQKQIAESQKAREAAERATATAQREADEARRYAQTLVEQGELSGDETERYKVLAKREAASEARESKVAQHEKVVSARLLHAEYGVPETDLLTYDDPKDMKIAALEWQRDHPDEVPPPATGEPTPPEPPPPQEPASAFDVGDGAGPGKRIVDMSDTEFEAHDKALAAKARREAATGRR